MFMDPIDWSYQTKRSTAIMKVKAGIWSVILDINQAGCFVDNELLF